MLANPGDRNRVAINFSIRANGSWGFPSNLQTKKLHWQNWRFFGFRSVVAAYFVISSFSLGTCAAPPALGLLTSLVVERYVKEPACVRWLSNIMFGFIMLGGLRKRVCLLGLRLAHNLAHRAAQTDVLVQHCLLNEEQLNCLPQAAVSCGKSRDLLCCETLCTPRCAVCKAEGPTVIYTCDHAPLILLLLHALTTLRRSFWIFRRIDSRFDYCSINLSGKFTFVAHVRTWHNMSQLWKSRPFFTQTRRTVE